MTRSGAYCLSSNYDAVLGFPEGSDDSRHGPRATASLFLRRCRLLTLSWPAGRFRSPYPGNFTRQLRRAVRLATSADHLHPVLTRATNAIASWAT
jgi:hypothetical protein